MANRGKKDTYQVQIEINNEEEWTDLCSKTVTFHTSLSKYSGFLLTIDFEILRNNLYIVELYYTQLALFFKNLLAV